MRDAQSRTMMLGPVLCTVPGDVRSVRTVGSDLSRVVMDPTTDPDIDNQRQGKEYK